MSRDEKQHCFHIFVMMYFQEDFFREFIMFNLGVEFSQHKVTLHPSVYHIHHQHSWTGRDRKKSNLKSNAAR